MTMNLHSLMKKWCREQNVQFINHGFVQENSKGYVDAILLVPSATSKGLVVFSHGTGNDLLYCQISLFKALVTAHYSVFTFDLDGHGINSSTFFSPEDIHSGLEKAIEIASKAASNLNIHLIGHSLGGAVTLSYLANKTEEIASAILISAPLHIPQSFRQVANELTSVTSATIYRQIPHYGLWNLLPAVGQFKRGLYPIRLQAGRDLHPLGYLHDVTKAFELADLAETATTVDVPTLLIYGDHDQIAPFEHGESLFESLSDCELFVVPNETHFTTLLSHKCEGKIISWLNKH